jgi:lysophospholipase L1-like esterase
MKRFILSACCMMGLLAVNAQVFDFDLTQAQPKYDEGKGYGWDMLAYTKVPTAKELKNVLSGPAYFSVKVPDGNYKVTVTLGSKRKAANTVVRAENRRLFVEATPTRKGEFKAIAFIVNKRTPYISEGQRVKIKEREKDYLNWDDRLTLEFNGPAPAVKNIKIERDDKALTVFLCGNSTVVDQNREPWASWGQMIPRWFGSRVAISNHAESGLTAGSFLGSNRLDKVLAMMKEGDYVFCEFGHNDQKEKGIGAGAWYNFSYNLKKFIDQVRRQGGNIVFVTPTQRRRFEGGKIVETHGEYPDAMRAVAKREHVPLIELHDMTRTFFETLGNENSKRALVHYPANTFPGQDKALADNTHFNPYGAYEISKMVVMGMKELGLPMVTDLRSDWKDYSPAQPDDWETFKWYDSPVYEIIKPDGN